MQNYYSITEFADVLRNKYPGQFDIFDDDNFLVRNLLLKYPDLSKRLNPDDLYEIFPEYKPMSVEMYEDYGESARAPFGTRFMHSSKSMLLDVVTTGGDLLGVDNIREWSKGIKNDWMRQDPSLQAYMLWREDEPVSRENFMDLDMIERGFGEMLPSYAAMFAAAGIATVASAPVGLVTLATIGTLEGTSEYVEARDILEKKGVPDNEAKLTSGLASLAYGIIAGYLERIPFFHAIRRFPGLKTEVGKKMHSRLMNAITNKVFSKGLGSQSFWARLASKGGVIGTEAIDGMFTEAVTEAAQGLSQNVINWGLENGWGDTPDEVMSNITKATREGLKDQELIEQAYGGAIGGGIFSGFGGAVGGAKRQKETIDYIDDFGETVAQKASDAAHGVPPTSAPAAPPVGDGEFTAPTFLESLAFDAPVYNYSTLAVDEDKAAAAAESTKDIESYQERAVKFIEEMGDPTLIDELSESARSNLLHGVGRWFKEEGILPADAKISTEKVRSMLDRIATGKAKIGTSIETAPGGDLVGVVKTLLADDIVKAKLESDIQFMMEDSQVNMADLNIGDMVVEEDPSITAVEGQIDVVTEEAVQAISDEQKADMLSVGDNVTIVGVDKHQGKSGEILKKTKKGVVLKVTLPDGKSKQITFPYKFIEPADIVTEKKSARDLIEDEIEIYNVKGEKYTAKVTARSEAGSIMVLNQEGEEVILDDDLTAVTQDVNSPTYQIQSAGLSATSQGEVVSEMSNEQLAEIESELAERLQKVAGSGQGAEQSAFMDLNAVKLAARKPAEERAEEEPPPRFFPKPGIGAMEKARAKDKAVPPLTLEDIDNELRPDPKRTVAAIVKAHEGEFTKSQAKSVYDSMRKRYAKFKKDPIAYLKAEIKQKEDGLKKGTYKKTNTKKYVQERLAQEKALLKNLEGAPTEKEEEPQETVIAEAPVEAKEGVSFDESGAMVIRQSPMSGKKHMMFIPGATEQQFRDWQEKGLHIQDAFPNLDAPEREFLLSGMTPTEWEAAFPPEPDETPYKVIDGPFKGAIVVTDEDGIVTAFDKPPDVGWNADMQEKDVIGQPLDFIGDPNELKEIGGTLEDVAARKAAEEEGDSPEFDKLPDPVEGSPTMTYTGVGSRDTPSDIRKQMNEVSKVLEKAGYTVNTGNAKGADAAFRYGVEKKNIFTPKDADDDTRKIAKEIHPLKEKLTKEKGLDLHARNTFQVFGKNLDTPVDFVLTWTKDGAVRDEDAPGSGNIRTIKTGGTGQAISLASLKGIPVINMANEGWQDQLIAVVGDQAGKAGKNALVELFKTTPMVAEDEEEDVTNVDEINDIKLDRSIAAAERYNKTGNLSMIIRGEIHDLTDEELKKMDEIEKAEGGIYKLGPKEVAQQLEFFQLKVTVFKRVTGESVRKDTPKAEKPLTPAGIKTKNFRTMTERKKEAAVQGDKSAQAEWAVEEVSEFYSAVEDGNISEIREEAMGLLRLAQHWPDNADVRLTVRKVIKDINKVFPTKESFNEAFDKWKAAKVKKGQAKEGVYVEDLKKTLEEIGQETPEERLLFSWKRNLQIKTHPAIIEERQKEFDEWYARQEKATFKNLQVMAKEHEIPDYKKMNREQLLEALKNIPPVELFEEMFDIGEEGDARLDKIIKAWEAKHPDQGELFSAEILAEGEILQPFLKDEKKLAELLEKRLERHFGEGKLGIIAHKFAGVIKRDGIEYVGKAIGNLVAWSEDKARIDDIPHEYFHVYAEIFAETPLMKYAFKKFTDSGLSEAEAVEQLTELVGNYYAGRIQEKGVINNLKAFFRQMWLSVKKAFGKASQEDLAAIIGERFFQGWVPTTAFLTPTKIPHYSTFNNTNDGNDDSVDDDGNQIEIDAIEALKENADAFLESIFLDVFAIYIPKSEYANVIQLANDSYDQEEFDLALRTHMVDNFGDEIAEGRGVTRAKVNSENVLLVGLPPNDVKGIQKRMRKYDLYSRQLFQRVKSSTPLGAYTVEEVDADGKKTYKTVLLDQMGRVVYDTYFVQKKGRIDGAPAIRLQRQNSVATGTTNPTSFRESFMERDFKEGKIDQRFGYMPMKNIYKYIVSGPNDEWNSFWVQDPSALKLSESWVYNINNLLAGSFGQNTKGDLAVFFSTKSGDNKISILAFAQRAWKGSQQAKYKGKTVNTTKIRRTFLEEELKAQVEMGWMSEKHMEDLISNAVLQAGKRKGGWKNPYAFAQELARHIAWQSTKGNDYLARQAADGVADTVNRLRLDFSEGTAVVGSGSRKVVWADHKDIEIKVEGRDGLVDVEIEKRPEVGEGYSQDGFMYVAASKLNQRGELLGVKPEHRAVSKTVIRNLEDGGNSYIAIKMLEMSADNGTMFFKKGSDIPFAKLKGTGRKAIFIMLDETGTEIEGSEFDSFATRNEVKDVSGRYTRDFTHGVDGIHELPEDATRVLIQPYKSNTTAPHPVLVHDMLMTNDLASFPEGVEYLDALEKHIKETGKRYMDLLMNFRTNPQVLRDYLKTELADGQMPTELDAYLDLFDDGWGVMLPQVSNQLSHMLANQFLINGLFKLRTDKMRGTKTFIKPRGHREVEPMSALISSQNSMMIERVGRDYRKEQGIGLGEAVPWDDLHSKVKVLNEWLEEREYNVLISRQPVSGPTVVEPRRVQAFYEGFQGDTIRLSEYDVFVLLDADNDGDITFIEVPEDKGLIDAMGNLSKTDYWKNRRKRKPLTIYKRSTRESSLSNGKAVGDYYSRNNMAEIATGMIVNAKVVMATMAAKELSLSANILPKGERIIARDPRDIIRMDYIPLSEDMTEQEYNTIIENGDNVVTKIEDKDGKVEWRAVPFKYLKDVAKQGRDLIHETTLENEMEILLSMATDNPKEQLLGEFEMDWNFLPSRMFKTLSGQPMRSKVLRGLRLGVSNTFKNAATRRGERQTRRGMKGLTMEDIFEESGKLRTLYFDLDGNVRPAKEVQKLLTEEFDLNTPQLKFWMGHQLGNMYLQWQDIRVNNHVSAVEHILSLPQLLMDLNPLIENESVAGSPLRYERWMYDDAHIKAVKDLNALVESKINTYMKSKEKAVEVGEGSLLMEEMAAEFEELLERAGTSMKNVEGIKYEYNTEFQEFIAKWLPRWNELSPRAQAWATLKFLSGTAKKNKKGRKTKVAFRHKLLPIQLMSPKIVKSYGRLFHKHLVGPIKEKKHVRPSDAAYDFQFKHFEKIAERVCG